MFIPVGVLAGSAWKWKGLWIAALMSAIIEILQLITARGLCEFDDIIHNLVGAVLGFGIALMIKHFRKTINGIEGEGK